MELRSVVYPFDLVRFLFSPKQRESKILVLNLNNTFVVKGSQDLCCQ